MFRSVIVLVAFVLFSRASHSQVIVAHRGASFDAPENTIAAFKEAWKQNADGIEGDFYITKDQQIVCIHDENTKRTGGQKLIVKDSTLAELRALEYGGWKDPKFRGEQIPTFAEVLAIVPPEKLFVIELKTGPEIIPLLKEELDRLQPNHQNLLIIAFNKDTVTAAKRSLPDIRVHWLTGYKQDKVTGQWNPTAKQILSTLKSTGADGLGTQGKRDIVNEAFLQELRDGGMKEFHVWTIDEPTDARFFQSQNAVGVTTNKPALIRQSLFSEAR